MTHAEADAPSTSKERQRREADEDAKDTPDAILRKMTRRFLPEVAQALFPPGTRIADPRLLESQIQGRSFRLDGVISVIVDRAQRLEHVEWQLFWKDDVPLRVFEYKTTLASAEAAEVAGRRGRRPRLIRSTVVLLSGPRRGIDAWGSYRISPKGDPFCGVQFRIDPIYQRTVAELMAREHPIWLLFTPLAVDVDLPKMASVIDKLRKMVPNVRMRNDYVAVILSLADINKRRRGLRRGIVSLLKEEDPMSNWLIDEGKRIGRNEGRVEGRNEGRVEGRNEGARESLITFYESRFGAMAPDLRARLQRIEDPATVARWIRLAGSGAKQDLDGEIARA